MNSNLENKDQEYTRSREDRFLSYTKKRHLQLLKKSQDLKSRDESLDKKESSELSGYSALLEVQIDWETRENYIEVFEKFITEEIDSLEFCLAFEERGELNTAMVNSLESNFILLSLDKESLCFSDLLSSIACDCDQYDENSEAEGENFKIELRNLAGKTLNQIQELIAKSSI